MYKVHFTIFALLFCLPDLSAQVGTSGGYTEPDTLFAYDTILPEDSLEDDGKVERQNVFKQLKTRMNFSKREMENLNDPRIRDLYWYALNDTTNRGRYLHAHYAFNEWRDNWSIEFRGGAQGVATNDIDERFSLGPQFELGFKKDIHPYWAIRADGYFSHYEHELYTAHLSTMTKSFANNPGTGGEWWTPIDYKSIGLRGAVMVNIVNFAAGREMIYTPWLWYGYGGAGFVYSFQSLTNRDGSCLVPQWFFGTQAGINFSPRYSLVLDANLSWQGDDLQGFATSCSTWKYALTLGVAYKFSKVIHFQRLGYDENFDNKSNVDADDYSEGDNLQNLFTDDPNTYNQAINNGKIVNMLPSDVIMASFFQIDRIELQHTYVLNLGFYAQLIKKFPQQKFLVKGFADIEVGSKKRNLWLSEQRAKVVADVLIKTYGVNPDQLIIGGGDLEYDIPFIRQQGHHRFNRCTIVCPLEKDYKFVKESLFKDKTELNNGRAVQ